MKRSMSNAWVTIVLLACASMGCSDPAVESAKQPFVADVVVTTDPGHGMLGAELVAPHASTAPEAPATAVG